MKLSLSNLQQIIREEYSSVRDHKLVSESRIDPIRIAKIIRTYDNDPTKMVPPRALLAAGVPVNSKHEYHVVYGQIVGQKDDVDVEYWLEEESRWEEIDDVERHHPVSVHKPKPTSD